MTDATAHSAVTDFAAESDGGVRPRVPARALITGGAGFIGCNLADALVRAGAAVTVLDNLDRPGSRANVGLDDVQVAVQPGAEPGDVRA